MKMKELINNKIVSLLLKASESGSFDTEKVLQFTKELDVNGDCLCDVKDIIRSFCKQQEFPNRPGDFKISSEQAVNILLQALRKVEQNDLAAEIEIIHRDIAPASCLVYTETTETTPNKMENTEELTSASTSSSKSFIMGDISPKNPSDCSVVIEVEEEEMEPTDNTALVETQDQAEKEPDPEVNPEGHCYPFHWPAYNNLKYLFTVACAFGVLSIVFNVYLANHCGLRTLSAGLGSSVSVSESLPNSTSDPSQDEENHLGLITISKLGIVDWDIRCPKNKYSFSLSNLHPAIKYYGVMQVGGEAWFCGGIASRNDEKHDQSKTCWILNMWDGQWRALDHKMEHPRIKPQMFVKDNKVIVRSGTTSDIHSKTGCRATQEVYDRENPTLGWSTEDIEENNICTRSSQNVIINCQ